MSVLKVEIFIRDVSLDFILKPELEMIHIKTGAQDLSLCESFALCCILQLDLSLEFL